MELKLLLDEDVPREVAGIARRMGLSVESVYECGRVGWSDEEQLAAAGREGRVYVTSNRNDYIELTRRFFHGSRPHGGVLIVPWTIRRDRPGAIARALRGWVEDLEDRLEGTALPPYTLTFLERR